MAVSYQFFNSQNHDRVYDASDWAKYFAELVQNGITGEVGSNALKVTAISTGVRISAGAMFVNGYMFYNSADYDLALTAPSSKGRIDGIMVRLDLSTRSMGFYDAAGTEADSPSAPSPTRSGNVYDMCLATAAMAVGATQPTTVTDKRSDTTLCGFAGWKINEQVDSYLETIGISAEDVAAINAAIATNTEDITELKSQINDFSELVVGKNKYNPSACNPADQCMYNSSGVYTTNMVKFATTGKIPVQASTQYIFSAGSALVYSIRYFSGADGSTFISGSDIRGAAFTTPQNCTYVAINLFYSDHTTQDYNDAIAVAQLELGETATAYEPYSVKRIVNLDNVEHGSEIAETIEDVSELLGDVAELQQDVGDLDEIKDAFVWVPGKNKYDASACNPTDQCMYNSSGVYTTNMAKFATTGKIPVQASTQYKFSAGGVSIVSVRYFSGESGGTFISGEDLNGKAFTTPQNCTYIAINLFYADHTTAQYETAIAAAQLELGNVATAYESYALRPILSDDSIEKGDAISDASDVFVHQSQINLYDKSLARDGVYINSSTGNISSAANYAITGLIPVKPNTQYNLSSAYDAPLTLSTSVYEYGINGNFLRGLTAPSKYRVVTFATSSDAYFIGVNMTGNGHTTQNFNDTIDTLMLCYGTNRPLTYTAYSLEAVVPNDKLGDAFFSPFNSFMGKKWCALGTSITWYDGNKYTNGVHTNELCRGYVGDIAALKKLRVNNLAISGSTLADVNSDSLINRMANIDWTAMDICTLEYGVNDLGYNIVVGTANDAPGTTTYAACLKSIIEYALTENPMLILIICTDPDVTGGSINSNGNTLKDYTDVTLDIAKLYRLPICDWYYGSGINNLTKGGTTVDYLTIDAKHPSDAGHRRMAAMLNQVFESLIC